MHSVGTGVLPNARRDNLSTRSDVSIDRSKVRIAKESLADHLLGILLGERPSSSVNDRPMGSEELPSGHS